tara:strand:- start:2417 stop:3250 length:834 start_codon:yes stop_codon:yes gene_type:complete
VSIKAMQAVWNHSKAKGASRLVLLALADHAGEDGIAWPSLKRLAKYTHSSPCNVSRQLSFLVEKNELSRMGYTKGQKGKRGSTKYRIEVVRNCMSSKNATSAKLHDKGGMKSCDNALLGADSDRNKTVSSEESPIGSSAISHYEPLLEHYSTKDKDSTKDNIQSKLFSQHFDDFWKSYPKKVGKGAARKAFKKALKTTSPENIMEGLGKYHPDPRFICNPATWLNQERWSDEHAVDEGNTNRSGKREFGNKGRNAGLAGGDIAEAAQRFLNRRNLAK